GPPRRDFPSRYASPDLHELASRQALPAAGAFLGVEDVVQQRALDAVGVARLHDPLIVLRRDAPVPPAPAGPGPPRDHRRVHADGACQIAVAPVVLDRVRARRAPVAQFGLIREQVAKPLHSRFHHASDWPRETGPHLLTSCQEMWSLGLGPHERTAMT